MMTCVGAVESACNCTHGTEAGDHGAKLKRRGHRLLWMRAGISASKAAVCPRLADPRRVHAGGTATVHSCAGTCGSR